MSIEIWDWGLGYIYLWDILIAWWGSWPEPDPVLFDFWDWTNSVWTYTQASYQWTVTKYTDKITFASGGFSTNYLSEYEIDWTRDFLLEFNGNIPNTASSYHWIWLTDLVNDSASIFFRTSYESSYRNKINCYVNSAKNNAESNPWTADYFIKKEWNTLTMWWGGITKYTATHTFVDKYYFMEQVYRDTLTINTAKLTYL